MCACAGLLWVSGNIHRHSTTIYPRLVPLVRTQQHFVIESPLVQQTLLEKHSLYLQTHFPCSLTNLHYWTTTAKNYFSFSYFNFNKLPHSNHQTNGWVNLLVCPLLLSHIHCRTDPASIEHGRPYMWWALSNSGIVSRVWQRRVAS